MTTGDPIELTRTLLVCPSITPEEGGALDALQAALESRGFRCRRLVFDEDGPAVDNLYARLGQSPPNFCFAGHTDVVPPGEARLWRFPPFEARVHENVLYGRGAVDMKGAIGAFLAAVDRFLVRHRAPAGSISLLITGDEEGDAVNGTRKVLARLSEEGERLDGCLVGEPTSEGQVGDMIKIGRRGSLTGHLTVFGRQGHSAYPALAENPVHHLVRMLAPLIEEPLDGGSEHFEPSTLQVTSVDVGNTASNVIPAEALATFNVRFNDLHRAADVEAWARRRLDRAGARYRLDVRVSGESFLSLPGPFATLLMGAVRRVTGVEPRLGTTGGTSDARFIKDHAVVAELGLLNAMAHKVDEHVPLSDLETLTRIYEAALEDYFIGHADNA